jgi:regulator of protease activity HflC (stomatin/prohibitin superfamily)
MNCGCCFCVSTAEVGLIENLGQFDRLAEPGFHCLNPCTEALSGRLSLRLQAVDTKVDSKTSDNAIVVVSASIQYKVLPERAQDAFYKFSNQAEQIKSFAANVIRGQVPKHSMDEIFVIRDEMQKALKDELDAQLAVYGFQIVATLITDIDPDDNVKQAMCQIRTNACLRMAAAYEADVEKVRIVKAAEADSEAKRLSGVGLAEQRKAAINGLQSSVTNFSTTCKGMTPKDVMALLMMNQYFDALKDIATHGRGSVVFLPGGGAGSDTMEGMLAAQAAGGSKKTK